MDRSLFGAANLSRQSLRPLSIATTLAIVVSVLLTDSRLLRADPARFWITDAASNPTGPVAPSLSIVNGTVRSYDIWAQPATVNAGAFSGGNPFKTMGNFSLNLVANSSSQSIVEIIDSSIVVYNPTYTPPMSTARKRWNEVNDYSEGLMASSTSSTGVSQPGWPDGIVNLFGYMLSPTSAVVGIGGSSCNSDPHCATLPGMVPTPVWRVASFAMHTMSVGSADYHLQIGPNGMVHVGDLNESAGTNAAFGTDAFGGDPEPIYNAASQRNTTNAGTDSPDLSLDAFPSPSGDFNRDGYVDAADYTVWRNNLGDLNEFDIGNNGDGGGVGPTDYTLWKMHYGESGFGNPGLGGAANIPEPTSIYLWLLGATLIICVRLQHVTRQTTVS